MASRDEADVQSRWSCSNPSRQPGWDPWCGGGGGRRVWQIKVQGPLGASIRYDVFGPASDRDAWSAKGDGEPGCAEAEEQCSAGDGEARRRAADATKNLTMRWAAQAQGLGWAERDERLGGQDD
jgi:hypothetical protein